MEIPVVAATKTYTDTILQILHGQFCNDCNDSSYNTTQSCFVSFGKFLIFFYEQPGKGSRWQSCPENQQRSNGIEASGEKRQLAKANALDQSNPESKDLIQKDEKLSSQNLGAKVGREATT